MTPPEDQQTVRALFEQAVEEFNSRRFFEAHETLETLWLRHDDPAVKDFYQGILQIGVGYYHLLEKQNHWGAHKKLEKGLNRLEPLLDDPAKLPQPVDIAALITTARRHYELLLTLGPDRLDEFPADEIPTLQWRQKT